MTPIRSYIHAAPIRNFVHIFVGLLPIVAASMYVDGHCVSLSPPFEAAVVTDLSLLAVCCLGAAS